MWRHGKIFPTQYEPRAVLLDKNIAKIPLGVNAKQGYAIVDKEFAWVARYPWYLANTGYPYSNRVPQKLLHRLVLNTPRGVQTDHINRNKLDNRLGNLRTCTASQNAANAPRRITNKCGLKGVSFDLKRGKYYARVHFEKKRYWLGYFDTPQEAHRAYRAKARLVHQEFACFENP